MKLAAFFLAAIGAAHGGQQVCYESYLDDGSRGYAVFVLGEQDVLPSGSLMYSVRGEIDCCWGGINWQTPTGPYPISGSAVVPPHDPGVMRLSHTRVTAIGAYGQPEAAVQHQAWTIPWPAKVGTVAQWDEVGMFAMPYVRLPPDSMVDYQVPATVISCNELGSRKWQH